MSRKTFKDIQNLAKTRIFKIHTKPTFPKVFHQITGQSGRSIPPVDTRLIKPICGNESDTFVHNYRNIVRGQSTLLQQCCVFIQICVQRGKP